MQLSLRLVLCGALTLAPLATNAQEGQAAVSQEKATTDSGPEFIDELPDAPAPEPPPEVTEQSGTDQAGAQQPVPSSAPAQSRSGDSQEDSALLLRNGACGVSPDNPRQL
jgi:hypothetical protein